MSKVSRRDVLTVGLAAAAELSAPYVARAQGLAEIVSIRSVPVAWT
jgi:hypothetical protein